MDGVAASAHRVGAHVGELGGGDGQGLKLTVEEFVQDGLGVCVVLLRDCE